MWRRAAAPLLARRPGALGATAVAAAGAAFVTPHVVCCEAVVDPLAPGKAGAVQREFSSFRLIPQTEQLKALMTILRDETTGSEDFVFYADRIIRTLVEEALEEMPHVHKRVRTPTGVYTNGVGWKLNYRDRICGVSIVRAGESVEAGLRDVCRGIKIGKILIQRDEGTTQRRLVYSKFPPNISEQTVLLLDPMLATGGSAISAIDVLVKRGVPQESIVFISLVSCPEGIQAMTKAFPNVRIVSAALDAYLSEKKHIVPGLGNFGDRYFGTA